jgi:THO complex subunit 1
MTDAPDGTDSAHSKETNVGDAAQDMDQLYATFWSLQQPFANPPSVWDPVVLESFKRGFEITLEKFKQIKHVLTTTKSEAKRGTKRKSENTEISNSFNPKYLTSRELFGLEVGIQAST